MTADQFLILAVVTSTIILFLWGRFRHDLVALTSLLACVLIGLVPFDRAFSGFSDPAVITVAAVLVLSQGLRNTGLIDLAAHRLLPSSSGLTVTFLALTGLGALLSAFINNVGAMALLMPIAMRLAMRHGIAPGKMLMPLAFSTILGGMTTLIGTPPNLIVAGYRAEHGQSAFSMFDYTPVGLAVALVGVLMIALVGWRLVPTRSTNNATRFDTGKYITEVFVRENSKTEGMTVGEADRKLADSDAQIVGMIRNQFRIFSPIQNRKLRADDILVIEAEPESLATVLSLLDIDLDHDRADVKSMEEGGDNENLKTEPTDADDDPGEPVLQEMVAMPNSRLLGQSAKELALHDGYGLNLLAISRQGNQSIRRLRWTPFEAGDVLLLQGSANTLAAFATEFGVVPLAERSVTIPDKGKAVLAATTMGLAILASALGLVPAPVAFVATVVVFAANRVVAPAKLYDAIDWPVIVLLGALLPVAGALGSTGTADLLAEGLVSVVARGDAIVALILVMVVTMMLSDFMNNAATAAVMCPIAISVASGLGANPDSYLMAVAIGASCAMLTPIGHQNNTLILGPGGFRFGDYWRLGLPLEIVVVLVAVPMLLWVWPI